WRKRKHISVGQLFRQPLILREPGSGSRWCLERALATAGRPAKDLQVALELGSNEAIKAAVRRGAGVSVLSDQTVKDEIKAGQLHALRIKGLLLEREMFVVWDRRRALPITARLFIDVAACPQAERP